MRAIKAVIAEDEPVLRGELRDMGVHLRVKLKERKETLAVSESYRRLFKQM